MEPHQSLPVADEVENASGERPDLDDPGDCRRQTVSARSGVDFLLSGEVRNCAWAYERCGESGRLADLLAETLPHSRFYAAKFAQCDPVACASGSSFAQLPLTTKAELLADQEREPPYGSVLTYPASGTTAGCTRPPAPRAGPCAGSTRRKAGAGCSTAGSRCSPSSVCGRKIGCSSRSRSGRSSASGRPSRRPTVRATSALPAGGMSSGSPAAAAPGQ